MKNILRYDKWLTQYQTANESLSSTLREKILEPYGFNLDSSLQGLYVKDVLSLVQLGDGRLFTTWYQ